MLDAEVATFSRPRVLGGGTKYRMREKLFAIGDDYWIENDEGERIIKVNGKALRMRDTFIIEDPAATELFGVQEKLHVRDTMDKIQGKAVRLSGFFIIVAVTLFGALFGVLGALTAVPIAATPDLRAGADEGETGVGRSREGAARRRSKRLTSHRHRCAATAES